MFYSYIYNSFLQEKKIVIKKDKFCKASLKEQYKLTIAFLATAGVEIESLKLFIEEGKNQHSKANQRTGYEQYYIKEEGGNYKEIKDIFDKIQPANNQKEIGLKIIDCLNENASGQNNFV